MALNVVAASSFGAAATAGAAFAASFDFGFGISAYSSTAAFEMQTFSRSTTVARTMMRRSFSFHISIFSVSPGYTESAKRTLMLLKKRGSPLLKAFTTARPTKPNVQRPCRIGFSKPNIVANSGSTCSGFQSPESR